jgi:uncharacterized membrane protein
MHADRQEGQRIYFLDELSSQASTSIEFLISALIAGTLIGAGFRYNQPILMIAAVFLAPRMAPVLGLAMGSILGKLQPVVRVTFNLIIMLVIVMVSAGMVGGMGSGEDVLEGIIVQYTDLNLLDFGFVVIGTVILAILVVQDGVFSPLPSAAVAYEILLPLGAFAVGIMGVREEIWRGALLNFALHLTWSLVSGMIVFLVMGFRPVSTAARNYVLAIITMSLIVILSLLSLGGSILMSVPSSTPAVVAQSPTETTASVPTSTETPFPTSTQTPTQVPPSETPLPPTPTPTPAIGVVYGTGGLGVVIRESPNGVRIGGLLDGDEVELIGGPLQAEGLIWWQILTDEGEEAWMTGTFLATATPGPP